MNNVSNPDPFFLGQRKTMATEEYRLSARPRGMMVGLNRKGCLTAKQVNFSARPIRKKLLESKHMSPFEHQARADGWTYERGFDLRDDSLWGNFRGWLQHRKMIEAA